MSEADLLTLPLHAIAHGRAGDKGDAVNISVIAYRAAGWPVLLEQVTEARALALFAPMGATTATRYVVPGLQALNFVLEEALQGGVNSSLGLDRHGKTLSFLLLGELRVTCPRAAVPEGSPYLS